MHIFIKKKLIALLVVVLLLSFFAMQLPTEDGSGNIVNWFLVFQWLFVGLVIFLFGMGEMEFALKSVAGSRLRHALRTLTKRPIRGAATGLVTTAIVQSSSVTTVMLVSFVSAGLLSFSRTIPPIIGANIGTTITAQLISFKISMLIPILILFGFMLTKIVKSRQHQRVGRIFLGIGFIFWGMDIMTNAMEPLRNFEPFLNVMSQMDSVLLAILIAAIFTAIVQSSSATMGVIIAFAFQGLITLEMGIALMFGASIGTTATAALAAIGKSRDAIRVAVAHILLRIFGVILFVGFIPIFAKFIIIISPFTLASAQDTLYSETARQIANAHTFFSISLAIIALPFVGLYAKFIKKIIPDAKEEENLSKQKHLISEKNIGRAPEAAIDGARLEINRMGRRIEHMFLEVVPVIFSGDSNNLRNIAEEDDEVDMLYKIIVKYLAKIRAQELSEDLSVEIDAVTTIARYIEQIGDIVETNLVPPGIKLADKNIFISDKTQILITKLHKIVSKSLNILLQANKTIATHKDRDKAKAKAKKLAESIIDLRHEVDEAANAVFSRTGARLTKAYTEEADIIESLIRAYYLTRNAAKVIAEK